MLECYLEPYETDLALSSFGYIFHLGYNLIRFPPGFLEVKNGKVIQISFLVQGMQQYDNGRTWYEETKCLPCPEQRECKFLRVNSYFENNFEPLYFRGTDPDNGFEEVKRDAGFLKKPSSQTDKQSGVPFQQTMRNPKI